MSDAEDSQPQATEATAQSQAEGGKSRNRRGSGKRGRSSEGGGEGNRPPKMRNDRFAMAGYGDGIERAFCCGMIATPPKSYPVQLRAGVAVKPPAVVAKRENFWLLCDDQHDGPHVWPDGEIEGEAYVLSVPEVISTSTTDFASESTRG